MQRKSLVASFGVLTLVCGCTSFTSTILNRLDDNSFVSSSNGEPCIHESARPFKGIPITLQVPSHLDIYIDETYFLQKSTDAGIADNGGDIYVMEESPVGTLRGVRADVIKSKKVFFVDFKRPASGTLDMGATFNDEQYFKSITSRLEDTTIMDSAALLGTVLNFATGRSTAAGDGATDLPPSVLRKTRVAAYRRFDINEPDFEQQVECFVRLHLGERDR